MKRKFIVDTSAFLSGKPIILEGMLTTPSVEQELTPGSLEHLAFQILKERGLEVKSPSKEAVERVIKTAEETGDKRRLSHADIEILALALDTKEAIILTDDYSIQNVANSMKIGFQGLSQRGIIKKFKWHYRCPGCGKKFADLIKNCPICGTRITISVGHKESIGNGK
jgi:UPF0271 protein